MRSEPPLPGMEGRGRDPFSLAELMDRETAVGLLSQPSAPEDFQSGIGGTRHGLTPEDERVWSVLQAIRPHKAGYFERLLTRRIKDLYHEKPPSPQTARRDLKTL